MYKRQVCVCVKQFLIKYFVLYEIKCYVVLERGNFTDSHDARNSIYSQRLCLQSSDDIVIDGAAATRRPAGNRDIVFNNSLFCTQKPKLF